MSELDSRYLDGIKKHEGFDRKAFWDYKQWTNGYGTRAKFPGEVIDRNTAEQRFREEIAKAAAIVDRHAPNAPPGVRAALTSLTYNAGDKWASSGLGQAVRSGDWNAARDRFLQYNKAGGSVLPALARRRNDEATWFNNTTVTPAGGKPQALPQIASGPMAPLRPAMNQGGIISTGWTPADRVPPTQAASGPISRLPSGHEVIPLSGAPEQQQAALQAAFDRGNRNMVYRHDSNPRVVASPGEASWGPVSDKTRYGGPNEVVNKFLTSNKYPGAIPFDQSPTPVASAPQTMPIENIHRMMDVGGMQAPHGSIGDNVDPEYATTHLPFDKSLKEKASSSFGGPIASAPSDWQKFTPSVSGPAASSPPQSPPVYNAPVQAQAPSEPPAGRMALGASGPMMPHEPQKQPEQKPSGPLAGFLDAFKGNGAQWTQPGAQNFSKIKDPMGPTSPFQGIRWSDGSWQQMRN